MGHPPGFGKDGFGKGGMSDEQRLEMEISQLPLDERAQNVLHERPAHEALVLLAELRWDTHIQSGPRGSRGYMSCCIGFWASVNRTGTCR